MKPLALWRKTNPPKDPLPKALEETKLPPSQSVCPQQSNEASPNSYFFTFAYQHCLSSAHHTGYKILHIVNTKSYHMIKNPVFTFRHITNFSHSCYIAPAIIFNVVPRYFYGIMFLQAIYVDKVARFAFVILNDS